MFIGQAIQKQYKILETRARAITNTLNHSILYFCDVK